MKARIPPGALAPSDWHRFAALLRLIRAGRGVGPSTAEIAAAWGLAGKSSATRCLRRLRAAGLIDWRDGRARTITVARTLVPVRLGGGDVLLPVAA